MMGLETPEQKAIRYLKEAVQSWKITVEIYLFELEKGRKIDALVDDETMLMTAAQFGYVEIVELLLKAGANVDAQDTFNRTALFYAVENGEVGTAKVLIQAGADLDHKNYMNKTVFKIMPAVKDDTKISALIKSAHEVQKTARDDKSRKKAMADVNAQAKGGMKLKRDMKPLKQIKLKKPGS